MFTYPEKTYKIIKIKTFYSFYASKTMQCYYFNNKLPEKQMDHVVFVEASSKELEKILDGSKTIILRGAAGRKLPYGKVNTGDTLYFINNNGEGAIKASATVQSVFNSEKMTPEESVNLIEKHEKALLLSEKQKVRFAGKRYIVLIEITKPKKIAAKNIDKSNFSNMDDWLPVGNIEDVIVNN